MFHRNMTPAENHHILGWEVADAAARTALSVSSDDISKICKQQSDNSFWIYLGSNSWDRLLRAAEIGSTIQAHDETLDAWAEIDPETKQGHSANLDLWSALSPAAKQDTDATLTEWASIEPETKQDVTEELNAWLAIDPNEKQDTLISGETIATINGGNILAPGNISLLSPADIGVSVQPYGLEKLLNVNLFGLGSTTFYGGTYTSLTNGSSAANSTANAANNYGNVSSSNRIISATGTNSSGSAGFYASQMFYRQNGFHLSTVFGVETHQAAMRYFVGAAAYVSYLNGQPSALKHAIGIGKDSGDSNWQIMSSNESSNTKVNTGAAVTAGEILKLEISALPNSSAVSVKLTSLTNNTVIIETTVTDTLPTQGVYFNHLCQSTSGTSAKQFSNLHFFVGETLWL